MKKFKAKTAEKKPTEKMTGLKVGYCAFLILWTAAIFLGSELLVTLLMRWILGSQMTEPLWVAIYGAITYTLALTVTILVPRLLMKKLERTSLTNVVPRTTMKKIGSISRNDLGLRGLPTWADIGLSIVGIFAYFVLAAIITGVFAMLFSWFDAGQAQDVGFNAIYNGVDRVIAFIALVVVAPIAEEILFRGWLYGKLRTIIPGKLSIPIAMLLVSILFGVLHGQWNVGVNVFALSLILCGLREITGTIWSGMIVHMIKNGIAFYILYMSTMWM